ncbi:ARC6/PARC6 family protein [Myxosarcina sp. GI1]|uniref:ARC6/PARC6 family protein n=1 Tax=Myxosarcina sp. GI1 TaxID=1541065 RepID=UPI00055CEC09|nr:ARC6/PARC6 family protein [Myxosarcina sp. GI1]
MAVKSSQQMKLTVQIPLDYYRILSVPVMASEQQLEQAYRDRLQQKPRREYSEGAITARQELIEFAYKLLSDSQCRADYNKQFFGNYSFEERLVEATGSETTTTTVTPTLPELALPNPTIDVLTEQMSGVLLILQELGEYELVLRLGIDYLNSLEAEMQQQQQKISPAEREDVVLSLALAYLELGRDQWIRREYERAALSGQMGLKLLARENLFPKVRKELEVDLFRLQPYRILELIAHNPVNSSQRNKGLQLLINTIRQRQEFEGQRQDKSSQNFEQFLGFIQQIRTYLTSAEQERVFVSEAKLTSATGDYLAAYVSLARGLALKQPVLVLRAERMLETMSQRQDVYWELAITSLLLGLSDRAIDRLQQSQEKIRVKEIEQYCRGGDLLPGLYVYGEQWLKQEVFSQFCDLARLPVTLNEYFADPQVQADLEEIDSAIASSEETKTTSQPTAANAELSPKYGRFFSRWRKQLRAKIKSAPASASPKTNPDVAAGAAKVPVISSKVKAGKSSKQKSVTRVAASGSQNGRVSNSPSTTATKTKVANIGSPTAPHLESFVVKKTNSSRCGSGKYRGKAFNPVLLRLGLLLGLIFGIGTLSFAAMKLFLARSSQTAATETESQLFITIDRPLFELPQARAETSSTPPQPTFTNEAKEVVARWLDSKSAAFGEEHQVEKLNEVLIGSLLTSWRDRALSDSQNNIYREYDHKLEIESAVVNSDNPQQATVTAKVKETARFYQQGNLDSSQSYDDDLLVQYSLVRQGNKWMIAGSEVLEIL